MTVIRKFFTSIETMVRGVWTALKNVVAAFIGGLRELMRSPGKTIASWLRSIVDSLIRLLRWLLFAIPRLLLWVWNWLKNVTIGAAVALLLRTVLVIAVVAFLAVLFFLHYPNSQIPEHEPADRVVYLGQGWGPNRDSAHRQTYYYTPQGTGWSLRNMRYSWFVNLEQPWGEQKFADPNRMRAYGFLVDAAPTSANPHQLPVGFAHFYDENLHAEVIDITCAACHTGSLLARQDDGTEVAIRIDGGPAMHAFTAMAPGQFGPVLLGSMAATYLNPFKFNRFARNVLGEDGYEEGKSALRLEFGQTLSDLLETGLIEKWQALAPTEEGFGRTDAIARIANMVFGQHLEEANYHAGDAPVSYPPTWNIWKFDWVQYGGSVAQPMARNLGESLGVGATYALKDPVGRPIPAKFRFGTSTRIADLHKIEETLRLLRPPDWPQDLLGKIDRAKAKDGGLLFIRTCQGCHGPRPAGARQKKIEAPLKTDAHPHWKMKMLSIYDIGTDPVAAVNFVRNTYDFTQTGISNEEIRVLLRVENNINRDRKLDYDNPKKRELCTPADRTVKAGTCDKWDAEKQALDDVIETEIDSIDLTKISVGQGLNYVGLMMREKLYREAGYTQDEQEIMNGFGALDLPQVVLKYKARPLAGMWATPPFVHNGSVRNMYQLLSPANDRDKEFFIGRREFDPVQLGFVAEPLSKGGFWFDTRELGNSNTGHEFRAGYKQWQEGDPRQYGVIGPEYTPDERYQLIEYLKVHHDDGPNSVIFADVLADIVAEIRSELTADAADIAQTWPGDQSCNLQEYLGNQTGERNSSAIQRDIVAINAQLQIYFAQRIALDGFECPKEKE